MANPFKLEIKAVSGPLSGDVVVFVDAETIATPAAAAALDDATVEAMARTAGLERFKGSVKTTMMVLAPATSGFDRVIALGVGPQAERAKIDWAMLGGALYAKLGKGRNVTVLAAMPGEEATPDNLADMVMGLRLRAYTFDRY